MNYKKPSRQTKPKKPRSITLLVSLIVHIGLVALVSLTITNMSTTIDAAKNKHVISALQSYLLISKPSPKSKVHAENEPKSASDDFRVEIQHKEEKRITIDEEPKFTKVLENFELPIDRFDDYSIAIPSLLGSSLKSPLIEQSADQATKFNNQTLTFKSKKNQKYSALISKHLTTYNASYAQQQAQQYRALKTSPIIDTTNAVNTRQIVMKRPVLEVNCNNTGSKILAAVSTLTNGTVNCAQSDKFQLYIDRRLNPHGEKHSETNKEN